MRDWGSVMKINHVAECQQEVNITGITRKGKGMKKVLTLSLLASMLLFSTPAFAAKYTSGIKKAGHKISKVAKSGTHGQNGKVTPKSIGAGALSLLIWPGIGQLMNDETVEKSAVHAVLGLTGVFRIWSCYDAVVDRKGGVWDNRI